MPVAVLGIDLGKNSCSMVGLDDEGTLAPEVPTIDEAGVPGLYASFWHGLWVPKGTPRDVVARLNKAVRSALADEGVVRRLADQGQSVLPLSQQTPEALGEMQKAEAKKWWPIMRAANITRR